MIQLSAAIALTFLALVGLINPGQVKAETTLISAPLPGGAGGVTCTCTNLLTKTIDITIKIHEPLGSSTANNFTIQPGYVAKYTLGGTVSAANCNVFRQDLKTVLTKHLSCTLSAIDINGYPIAVEPVNKKYKIQR